MSNKDTFERGEQYFRALRSTAFGAFDEVVAAHDAIVRGARRSAIGMLAAARSWVMEGVTDEHECIAESLLPEFIRRFDDGES